MSEYCRFGIIHLVCTQNFPKKLRKNVSFSENFAHVLNEWFLSTKFLLNVHFRNVHFINYFRKKLYLRCLTGFRIHLCISYSRHRTSHQRCSIRKAFLEISHNSQENTCARVFFNKVTGLTLAQVFSCEFWEISKNTFFTEHLWATVFGDIAVELR